MKIVAVLGLVAIGLACAAPASAHALLAASQPEDGTALEAAPDDVTLTFTEAPDPQLTSVRVLDTSGRQVGGEMLFVSGPVVRLSLRPLEEGVYTVAWRTVSRVDGHSTAGTLAFGIGREPEPGAASSVTLPAPRPLSTGARVMLYAGLAALIGGALTGSVVFGRLHPAALRIAMAGWPLAALGTVAIADAQRSDAGAPWSVVAGTSVGRSLLARAVPLALSGVLLVAAGLVRRRVVLLLGGVAASLVALAHVANGHAGAGPAWPLKVAVQWTHVTAFALWIGGLLVLVVATRGESDDAKAAAVRRFSRLALLALAAVAVTGTARAVNEVGAWDRLVSTSFGRLVLLKVILLLGLAALGAVNRYRSVPRARSTLGGLRRVSTAELALASAVLVATGFLAGTAPAASGRAERRPRIVVEGSDFGTSVRATLTVAPGAPGLNRYTLRAVDYDTEEPVDARRLTLLFSSLDDPSLGATAELERGGDAWTGRGAELSVPGRWRVIVLVERAADSVQVSLTITIRRPPQRVRVDRAPGQPDLYTIEIGPSRTVQMYVDPGRPGRNDVHATYFEGGRELASITEVTIAAVSADGERAALEVRPFGPGHVVAAATLTKGRWRFTARARGPSGEVHEAAFSQRID